MSKIDFSNSLAEGIMTVVLAFLVIMAVSVAAALATGAVIWLIWNFAVPIVWLAAPHLSYWKAVIIGLIITLVENLLFSRD